MRSAGLRKALPTNDVYTQQIIIFVKRKYKIYFQLFGRKMVTVIEANTKAEAVTILRGKLEIDLIKDITPEDDLMGELKSIFNI